MVRRISVKQRGVIKRRQKKIVLMGAEGKNQTERKYFESFNRIQDEYRVIFSNGSHTDPEGVIKDLIKSAKSENLDEDYGDLKVCMLDVDYPGYREKKLKAAIKISEEKNVQLYLSNPCFEIWYLLHFNYSTKQYISNNELIKDLQGFIPNYTKSKDVFNILKPNLNIAIKNAERLEGYQKNMGVKDRLKKSPSTEIYKLVKILNKS